MIDVISNVASGGGASVRQAAPARSAPPPPQPAPAAAPSVQPSSQGSLRIRVDNQLDIAILEYRSSESGEVVNQYPTEAQVKALTRGAELETRPVATAAPETTSAEVPEVGFTGVTSSASGSESSFTPTVTPAADTVTTSTTGDAPSTPSIASTQSITV